MSETYLIPGISKPVTSDQPIYRGSNFTWGEATRNGERLPVRTYFEGKEYAAQTISSNIVRLANRLDTIRSQFGDRPILVTSWLRPPEVNREVGGVENSQHLLGWAADIRIDGYDPHEVAATLMATWQGGLGDSNSFTHLDLRHFLGMSAARWDYGNA